MDYNLYLATSVTGDPNAYEDARCMHAAASRHGEILTKHLFIDDVLAGESQWKREERAAGRSGNICERDLAWLDAADALIALVGKSFGVGGEVYYALYKRKIPVLALYRPYFGSKMLRENTHPLLTKVEYSGHKDIEDAIADFFAFPGQEGRIFTIDGGDGAGKKTQTKLLVERLRREGFPVETCDFPHDRARYGMLIRDILAGKKGSLADIDPLFFSSLYAFNRDDVAPVIRHWKRKGRNIIFDRYVEANWGHQASKLPRDVERRAMIGRLQRFEWDILGIPKSDRVVYLDLPVDVAEEAMRKDRRRVMDIHETAGRDYKENVRKSFLWCAREFDWIVINCLDDRGARISEHVLAEQIYQRLLPEFVNKVQ